ncbi:MAG: hypothetical protein DSY80_03875, partial [Desulfocapsa sp.]
SLNGVYNDCHKVWSSRGIYGGEVAQNSLQSFVTAFARGAQGVEVDVFYDLEQNDYIVSHDFPYRKKDGKVLLLSTLFEQTGDGHYFWLDFKDLRKLSSKQANAAVQRLQNIAEHFDIKARIYVEGEHPSKLSLFRDAGFNTLFDTHPEAFGSILAPLVVNAFKMAFYFGNYTVMGMEYGPLDSPVYSEKTRHRLANVPVFLYHVPVNSALLDKLLPMDTVRAFLVGNGQSVNYHYKNNCSQ